MKTFILKESSEFRIIVQIHPCDKPDNLYCVEFIQETLDNYKVIDSNTYQFFLSEIELSMLSDRIKL